MTSRKKLWLIATVLYAAFFAWYTNLSGPLSNQEIQAFLDTMAANGAEPETMATIEKFARADSGRQFLMLNAIDYNESPPDVEGAEPGESAEQLMGRYMEHMFPALLSRACHPAVLGTAVFPAMDIVGIEGAEQWDMGAMMRYRSRRDLLEIVTNPAFAGKHHFKLAALNKTIAYPVETRFYLGDPRLILALLILSITALLDGRLSSRQQRTDSDTQDTGSST